MSIEVENIPSNEDENVLSIKVENISSNEEENSSSNEDKNIFSERKNFFLPDKTLTSPKAKRSKKYDHNGCIISIDSKLNKKPKDENNILRDEFGNISYFKSKVTFKVKGEMDCPYCSVKYTKRSDLILHIEEHLTKELQTCVCGFVGDHLKLKEHTEECHPKQLPFSCPCCALFFSDCDCLMNHLIETHIWKMNYNCDFCHFKCTQKPLVIRHIQKYHVIESELFSCDKCSFCCYEKNAFVDHMKCNHNDLTMLDAFL